MNQGEFDPKDPKLKLLFMVLMGDDEGARFQVIREIARYGEAAVEPLILLLNHPKKSVAEAALGALMEIGEPAVPGLVKALKNPAPPPGRALQDLPKSREMAALLLSQIKNDQAVLPLCEALKDESPKVRTMAAFSLGEIGRADAKAALLQACKDGDEEVRTMAKNALVKLQQASRGEPHTLWPEAPRGEAPPVSLQAENPEKRARDLAVRALKTAEDMNKQEEALKMIDEALDLAERHDLASLKSQLTMMRSISQMNIERRDEKKNKWRFWKKKKKKQPSAIFFR